MSSKLVIKTAALLYMLNHFKLLFCELILSLNSHVLCSKLKATYL